MERKWWTLVLVSIATFMLLLDVTVVNVALPDIQRELNASLSSLQWVVDAYSLTLAAFLLTAGSLGDRLGRRRVFTIGFGIFTFASFLCGIAERPDPAQPGARAAGRRRRRDVRHLAGPDRPGVPRQRPGDRVRRLGGDGRRRRRGRAAGRRRRHRDPRLGVDLLPQRPDRDRRDGPDRAQDRQRLRQRPGAGRRARPRHLLARPLPADLRADPRQPRGLGQPADPRLPDRRRRAAGGVHRDRAPQRAPDARPLAVPQTRLQRGLGGRLRALGRDVRDVPLPDHLHAGRARLLAAGGGPALPAADRARLHRRADLRGALAQDPDPGPARHRACRWSGSACC